MYPVAVYGRIGRGMSGGSTTILIEPDWAAIFAQTHLTAQTVFSDPRIHVWRNLSERQNATFDFVGADGGSHRWHIKRYLAGHAAEVGREVRGIGLLREHGIATVALIAHGTLSDGRAFLITDDLTGFAPADKLPADVLRSVLEAIVELAALLHAEGLHHQDLYLCHFFVRTDKGSHQNPVHLIDAGRVRCLPPGPLRYRWIVKDLAQLMFSLRRLDLSADADRVMGRYCDLRRVVLPRLLRWCVGRKVNRIAAHDRRLSYKQPGRDVSLLRKR